MLHGQLSSVIATERRIDLELDARPVHFPPHRAGHKARELEENDMEEMLRLDIIEPASIEWSSSVVIGQNPDRRWRFSSNIGD